MPHLPESDGCQTSGAETHQRLRIGVSACLLGEPVRYDGAHKRDAIVAALACEFELVPVCPEVGIGLGVPRPPIQLEGPAIAPRAVGVSARDIDVTEALLAFGTRTARELSGLSGFIFKSRSPSCGVNSTPIHHVDGTIQSHGRGLFAHAFMAGLPCLPVEESDGLADPRRLEDFLCRVRAHGHADKHGRSMGCVK